MLQKRAVFGIWVVATILLAAGPARGKDASDVTSAEVPTDAAPAAQARIGEAVSKAAPLVSITPEVQKAIHSGAAACQNSLDNARNACLEKLSPIIQGGMAILSGITTVVGSVKDQCSQSAQNLDKAQNIMTLYNGACSGFKMICEQRCKSAKARAQSAVEKECKLEAEKTCASECVAFGAEPTCVPGCVKQKVPVCVESANTAQSAFAEAEKVCKDYQMNLMAAGAALAKILMDKGKAEKCKEESGTVDCTKDPTNASCNQKLDCSLAANSANPICICEKSPRSPGCGGSTNVSSTNDYMKNTGTPAPANALGGAPSSLGSGLNDSPYYGGGGSNGSGGGGLAGGGGGAGGGGSGAAKGTDGSNKGEKAALNANVLEGGGGGGGFRGGSGGGYNANDPYGKYKAYIPKDGNGRGLAGTTAADQVTGSNGLSNWEKVKAQYTNMKPTLLGR